MKLSSSFTILAFTSVMAIATADEIGGHASMTTLRGGRHTLRGGRHLKKKKSTETSQSSDDPQEGRNINAGGAKKKKKAKSKGKAKQDIKKTITQVSGAFSQISSQLKEFESKNVLGQGPLSLQPGEGKEEGTFVPETPTTWTPPSSIAQEEAKEDMPNDAETPGSMPDASMPEKEDMPDASMPEKEDMPDASMPEKEGDNGMPEKDIGGAPEVSKPEMEMETMPEKDDSDNSIGTVVTTPVVEEKPDEGVPPETSPPEVPEVQVEPPANTTPTTGTTGTSSGNASAQRPIVVGANCDLNIASLVAKENPATTTKRCKASCECAESCCISYTFGAFCAAPHPSKEGVAALGGGFRKCMHPVEPSQ